MTLNLNKNLANFDEESMALVLGLPYVLPVFSESLNAVLVNSFPVSFVLASSWAEDTKASMNSQFISPEIGGSLLCFFSPLMFRLF